MASKIGTMILALAIAPCIAQSNLLLQITSPASGTIVNPGQVVTISVSADPSVSNVGVVGQYPLGSSATTNGQSQLTIPSNTTIGPYNVSALGNAADGSLVVSSPISLQVDTPNTQFTITTEPSVLRFSAPGETIPLHVIGTFPDGSQLDMTHSVQMTYLINNSQVATVDGQGIVTAVGPGSTYITAGPNNGPYSVFVNTRVGQLATISSPGINTMLYSSSVTFQWNGSSTATAYRLEVGSTQGGNDYYESGSLPTTTLSHTVTGLPINDGIQHVFVTLWTQINGQWANNQYDYTFCNPTDFTISASPSSLTIRQGQHGTATITTTISGFFMFYQDSSISLSASGLPSRTTASFNPSAIRGAGSSTLTLSVDNRTPVGTYPITVAGYGGWIQHTTPITLTVVRH